jgi:hypothetical protein
MFRSVENGTGLKRLIATSEAAVGDSKIRLNVGLLFAGDHLGPRILKHSVKFDRMGLAAFSSAV